MGMPIITKKYLLCKTYFIWRNSSELEKSQSFKFCVDVLTHISNEKKFCQINFCEYRSFIFRKTLNFIVFVEILAYSKQNFCEWQNLKKIRV